MNKERTIEIGISVNLEDDLNHYRFKVVIEIPEGVDVINYIHEFVSDVMLKHGRRSFWWQFVD